MKSEVLKSNPEILSLISKHLFGQLEGFVNSQDPEINKRWEVNCSEHCSLTPVLTHYSTSCCFFKSVIVFQ